ncbi:proton-coupled amino acid transporter-like protein CG1139 [Drosophila persimilis]|uniref:proton-coupled amino acid transporter-like protein CG1139 n=1 Tax=Drosophila persimilis TaxID=7234 RepID=UPI000F095BA0|nr:proton-coupled amino acid transporter-like protein CG1139 [Drosophila persimilis]
MLSSQQKQQQQKKVRGRRHRLAIRMDPELKRNLVPFHVRALGVAQRSMGSPLVYEAQVLRPDVESTMTDLETFLNLVKCAFGTGCLAMPRAFYNAGWLIGLLATVLIGFIVVYAMHVLLNDIQHLCRRHRMAVLSYRETMELALLDGPTWLHCMSRPLGYFVDILMCAYHFGVDCVYIVFIAKNLKFLGDLYLYPMDLRLYMALLILPLILTFLVRNLKYLLPFTVISNILTVASFGIIFWYLVQDLPSLEGRQATQHWTQFPLFFGTVLFAIESLGVILALQRSMRHPENFLGSCGVLNRAMVLVVLFYASFGFFGYWQYGRDTANSILHNLPPLEILPQCVMGMFAMAMFFSYALQGYVTVDIIWRGYMRPKLVENVASGRSVEYLVRLALVIASVLVAIGYPDFGLLLSFVGSFCLAQLGLIFPGIVNMCVLYSQGYGYGKILLWRSLFFLVLGLCGGISGTVISVKELNEAYPIVT